MALLGFLAVDKILSEVLGHGRPGSRATIYDMVAWDTSLIATTSQELLELLQSWRPRSTRWELAEMAGADMLGEADRLWARAHVLQLHAGIVDTFELRMSKPPYNLLVLTDPTAPVEEKRSSIEQAMSTPAHCRSLFVQRLLQLCPSPDALLGKGAHILRAWSKGSMISIDWAERSHAQHRADMKSSGRARSAAVSSNRVLLQNVRSEMLGRSLPDPAAISVSSSAKPTTHQPQLACDLQGEQRHPPQRKHGGNPYFEFQNFTLHKYKLSHCPHRALTDAERELAQGRAREAWEQMDDAQHDDWRRIFQGRSMQRRLDGARAQIVPHGSNQVAPVPLWSLARDSETQPIPIAKVCCSLGKFRQGRDTQKAIHHDPSLVVMDPVPQRVEQLPEQVDGRSLLFGCCNNRLNICRRGLDSEVRRAMDDIRSTMSKWVDDMGTQTARRGESVLWARGSPLVDVGGRPVDLVFLLVDFYLSPKMQYWARCANVEAPHDTEFELGDFPCMVTLVARPNRVARHFREIDLATSDEVAYQMASMNQRWTMRPLTYTVRDTPSLLEMRLLGAGDALASRRSAQRSSVASPFDEAMFLGDPMLVGAAMAPSGPVEPQPGAQHEAVGDAFVDDDLEAPADVVEDILNCEAGVAESAFPDVLAGQVHDFRDDANLFEEEEPNATEEAADEGGDDGDLDGVVSAEDEEMSIRERARANAMVSPMGYIATDVVPWSAMASVGRITSWPASVDLAKRSVSCRCYMHPGCSSPARRRAQISDAELIDWLFSEKPLDAGATTAARKAAAAVHRAKWATAIALAPAGGMPASSSDHGARGP